eukprot:CAMPEP_0185794840 /NCGR_PEP_ID=MMETSP1174-20130828/160224_1 /TAXON_ID=35687 /ORGANISM="Dictyocha speculum, Strain CCMP1381" /LENGTH=237 /DNA_ID=CAMNT_0028490089 /DNA_START=541 /DNA_END=1254 /DNA_ORIENTATION=-
MYRGTKDKRYQKNHGVDSVGLVEDFFAFFSSNPGSYLHFEDSLPSTHVWPTKNYGPKCGTASHEAIEACGYDGAKQCLKHAHGADRIRNSGVPFKESSLHEFDQRPFFGRSWPGLADTGFVYVPEECATGTLKCGLHLALHGCGVDHYFHKAVRHLGFNEIAEANQLIILWPRMKPNDGNDPASKRHFRGTFNTRLGCWDSWGETGYDFAAKSGLQMAALWRMIRSLHTKNPNKSTQ